MPPAPNQVQPAPNQVQPPHPLDARLLFPPQYQTFDNASVYRLYQDPAVPGRTIRVTVLNRHPNDRVVFECWRTQGDSLRPATEAPGGGEANFEYATDYLAKLVWVGHHHIDINIEIGNPGYSVDFIRQW